MIPFGRHKPIDHLKMTTITDPGNDPNQEDMETNEPTQPPERESRPSTSTNNADANGILRYFTVVNGKRKRGQQSNDTDNPQGAPTPTSNRYAILAKLKENEPKPKPPALFIRERSTIELDTKIKQCTKKEFYLVDLKKGNLYKTKVQVTDETNYTQVTKWLDSAGKKYYSFQMKCKKGLRVVLKGIHYDVSPEEIKADLERMHYKVNWVHNIINKFKIPQPMFKVELLPESSKPPNGKTHPIYDLKYVVNRKITVEEPYKRKGPVQCLNCQEFGHTKSYCKLQSICVACGGNHPSAECANNKDDPTLKRCSNCVQNHTANYRGCPVYETICKTLKMKSKNTKPNAPQTQPPVSHVAPSYKPYHQYPHTNAPYQTYSDITANKPAPPQINQPPQSNDNITQMLTMLISNMQQLTNIMMQMQEQQKQQMESLINLLRKP